MEVRPGSMGKPYPGHAVSVIDEAGDSVADGTVGELAPRRGDPVMFLGYWGCEDATREKFAGDWFRTAIWATATPTATTGSWAGRTTSSRARATASAPGRSRIAC